jgi:hypothetical protein
MQSFDAPGSHRQRRRTFHEMKPYICYPGVAFVMLSCVAPTAAATCAPTKLVHVVVSNVSPGIDAASFGAKPKVFYRIGSDKLRVEEALDAANGIHGIMVVSEPNIWMANLYDGTGKHIVDPGPTFFAKAPVVGAEGIPPKLLGLEFGCEADYIAANAPKPVRSEHIGTDSFDVYRVEDGADAVEILERPASGTPALVRYYHQNQAVMILRYDLYETGLANDPALFMPPANVRYTDVSSH